MKLLKILLILSLAQFYSCSKSQDQSEATDDPSGVEIADSGEEGGDQELDDSALEEEGDVQVADATDADSGVVPEESVAGSSTPSNDEVALDDSAKSLEEVSAPTDNADQTSSSEYVASSGDESVAGSATTAEAQPAASTDTSGIGDATYNVKSNETLMLIAFKLYGDYGKWKEIAALNQDKLNGSTLISPGMQLRYNTQGANFNWAPNGKEHIVKSGDTLSLISNQYYATIHKWKMIWENNKPLIKDPNKIFVGFTLYVPEKGMRDMASQPEAPLAENSAPAAAPAASTDMAKGEAPPAPAAGAPAEDFPEDI